MVTFSARHFKIAHQDTLRALEAAQRVLMLTRAATSHRQALRLCQVVVERWKMGTLSMVRARHVRVTHMLVVFDRNPVVLVARFDRWKTVMGAAGTDRTLVPLLIDGMHTDRPAIADAVAHSSKYDFLLSKTDMLAVLKYLLSSRKREREVGWLVGLCYCCCGPLHCKMEAESDRTLLKQLSQIHAQKFVRHDLCRIPRFHYAANVCLFKFHHGTVIGKWEGFITALTASHGMP